MGNTCFTRTLDRALSTAGSRERLARQLHVSESALDDWLKGGTAPPVQVYVAALDIVAKGPFALRKFTQAA